MIETLFRHSITETMEEAISELSSMPLAARIDAINALKMRLHEISPFKDEPVDCVIWVENSLVAANDYNPNSVAPPEMKLLERSIEADGYTQPIVAWERDSIYEVVDGFHRNRVGKESKAVRNRVHGYLPLAVIRSDRDDKSDRIAATIRHNRARGKHKVESMSDIVMELKRRNWSNDRIGVELGMDADEVLRLSQITGLAEMFANQEFSEAWEHSGDEIDAEEQSGVNLEWLNDSKFQRQQRPSGWNDRSESSSVLLAVDGKYLGAIQKSRFEADKWFWYAFTAPMSQGFSTTKEIAVREVESKHGI